MQKRIELEINLDDINRQIKEKIELLKIINIKHIIIVTLEKINNIKVEKIDDIEIILINQNDLRKQILTSVLNYLLKE